MKQETFLSARKRGSEFRISARSVEFDEPIGEPVSEHFHVLPSPFIMLYTTRSHYTITQFHRMISRSRSSFEISKVKCKILLQSPAILPS